MLTSSCSRDINFTYPRLPEQVAYVALLPERTASPPPNKTYEYIVVGSGPGGSPLAARLALAGHSVLLIDAGADHGGAREVQIPAMSVWASERTELSWAYYTHHYEGEEQTKRDRKLTYRTKEGDLYSGKTPPPGAEMLGNYYPRVGGLGGKSTPLGHQLRLGWGCRRVSRRRETANSDSLSPQVALSTMPSWPSTRPRMTGKTSRT